MCQARNGTVSKKTELDRGPNSDIVGLHRGGEGADAATDVDAEPEGGAEGFGNLEELGDGEVELRGVGGEAGRVVAEAKEDEAAKCGGLTVGGADVRGPGEDGDVLGLYRGGEGASAAADVDVEPEWVGVVVAGGGDQGELRRMSVSERTGRRQSGRAGRGGGDLAAGQRLRMRRKRIWRSPSTDAVWSSNAPTSDFRCVH
ncbi:hypothetical protein CRG98_015145 [Punica granatum]|uniref:Uncharacterized protein n=1 Tax=Punica granatum TaxID=22663 RepID=A0A2I0K7E2_PUNGR|nr:hypothetical protein CRG98_015145 [Punica granatum]